MLCLQDGRFQRSGQKHSNVVRPCFLFQRKTIYLSVSRNIRKWGSRGIIPLVRVWGHIAPGFPPFYTAFSAVMATVISAASLQAASIFSFRG